MHNANGTRRYTSAIAQHILKVFKYISKQQEIGVVASGHVSVESMVSTVLLSGGCVAVELLQAQPPKGSAVQCTAFQCAAQCAVCTVPCAVCSAVQYSTV